MGIRVSQGTASCNVIYDVLCYGIYYLTFYLLSDATQYVPIPCVAIRCNHGCCERTLCPLQLSFAKTIDTFQGLNAGPVDEGKPPNAVQRIICDPGSRQFEGSTKPGLFYTMLSRATTIGHLAEDGLRYDSAIYFYDFGYGKGPCTVDRIHCLRKSLQTDKTYERIKARDRWMRHLEKNNHGSGLSDDQIVEIFDWAQATRIPVSDLDVILNADEWREHYA